MHKVFGLFLVGIYYKMALFLTFWMFVYVNIYINIYKQIMGTDLYPSPWDFSLYIFYNQ